MSPCPLFEASRTTQGRLSMWCASVCGAPQYVVCLSMWCASVCGAPQYVVRLSMWCASVCGAPQYVVRLSMWCASVVVVVRLRPLLLDTVRERQARHRLQRLRRAPRHGRLRPRRRDVDLREETDDCCNNQLELHVLQVSKRTRVGTDVRVYEVPS